MNEISRRTAMMENEGPAMKLLAGKAGPFLPAMRSKSRALENVENVCKPSGASNHAKTAAMERQRANAEKLSKGYSVVPRAFDKENAPGVVGKDRRTTVMPGGKENASSTSLSGAAVKPVFRVPAKPAKQRKPFTQIVRTASVTSLQASVQEVNISSVKTETPVALSELIIDDDKKFEKDEFLLGIYAKDIYKFLKCLEVQQGVRPGYLTRQHVMKEGMRTVLVDWMFEVQQSFNLLQDTVQMSIGLLDRFMQDEPLIAKEDLQLVGVTCIFIASKYEEMYPPSVEDLVISSADAYTKRQLLRMELCIFRRLGFSIGRPPPIQFLRRYCRVAQVNTLTYNFSKYFVDLALLQYRLCHLAPSLLAAAALYLALFVQSDKLADEELWTPTIVFFTEYTMSDLKPVLPAMARLVVDAPSMKQQSVQKIYVNQKKPPCVTGRPELSNPRLIALARPQTS